jgi:hypothetical protein
VKSITTIFKGYAPESSEESLGIDEMNSKVKRLSCPCQRLAVMSSSTDFRISWVDLKFQAYSASLDPSRYIMHSMIGEQV